MRSIIIHLSCTLAQCVALAGCWEPEQQQSLVEGQAPSHTDCEAALDTGLAGDACSFEGGCGRRPPAGDAPFDSADCVGSGMLLRYEVGQGFDPDASCEVPRRIEHVPGGCVRASDCQWSQTFCVDDGLLPPPVGGVPWPLDGAFDCGELTRAEPGDPCEGDRICTIFVRSSEPSSGHAVVYWCHDGRLHLGTSFELGPFVD